MKYLFYTKANTTIIWFFFLFLKYWMVKWLERFYFGQKSKLILYMFYLLEELISRKFKPLIMHTLCFVFWTKLGLNDIIFIGFLYYLYSCNCFVDTLVSFLTSLLVLITYLVYHLNFLKFLIRFILCLLSGE